MPKPKSNRQEKTSKKRGDDRNETALKHRKVVTNFKQSKDIHEDRGRMQTRLGKPKG